MNKWFFISYDLDKPGQNYENLWAALRAMRAQRVQDSVWLLKANGNSSAKQIADGLMRHIDNNDRLVVIQSGESAWYNLMINPNAA